MREKTIKWLAKNNYPIAILHKKWKMPLDNVVLAAEIVYERVQSGKKTIKPIQIGWLIRQTAQTINNACELDEVRNVKTIYDDFEEIYNTVKQALTGQNKNIKLFIGRIESKLHNLGIAIKENKENHDLEINNILSSIKNEQVSVNNKINELRLEIKSFNNELKFEIESFNDDINMLAEENKKELLEKIDALEKRVAFNELPIIVKEWKKTVAKYKKG